MKALASSSFEVATLASSSSGGHINLFEDLEQVCSLPRSRIQD